MLTKRKIKTTDIVNTILFAVPIIVIIYCFSSGISGNDFWWHVKVGEYVAKTGTVPTTDIFSWYGMEQGLSWVAHEWLADLILYYIHHVFSDIGIFTFSIMCATSLYLLLRNHTCKESKRNVLFSGLFFSLFAVLTSLFFYGRPHIFSYFLLFFELKFLYEFKENEDSKKIYFIPLLAVLWSNLHGGSSNLSYLLCILFIIAGLIKIDFGRIESKRTSKKGNIKLICVTLASMIGIMINPIGLKVLTYPYVNLSDNLSLTLISEWQAPDAKLIGNLILYFLPIVVMSIGLISEKRKIQLVDLLVMLSFLFLFFRSARFIILWYIAAAFYSFSYMPEIKVKDITKTFEKVTVGLVAILLIIPIFMGCVGVYQTAKKGELISKVISQEAIGAIKDDSPRHLYNDYNIGETLIYNDIPVFFDARADLYAQDNIMADGVSMMYLEQANNASEQKYVVVDDLIKKYDFDAIAILKIRSLYSYIKSHPERFESIYEDEMIGYFRIVEVSNE